MNQNILVLKITIYINLSAPGNILEMCFLFGAWSSILQTEHGREAVGNQRWLHLLIGFIGQLIILFRWLRFENWTPKKKKECFCLPVFRVWSTDGPVVLVLVAPEVLSQSNWSSPVCWVQLQKLLSKSQSVGRPVPVSSKKSMRCCLNHDSRIQTRGNRLLIFQKV